MNEENSSNQSSANSSSRMSNHSNYQRNAQPIQKRPQVYSNYIQPNLQNRNTNNFKNKPQSSFKSNGAAFIKKPKFNQEVKENNSQDLNSLENQEILHSQNDDELNAYLSTFIGVNTFQSENVFLDLIQKDMILVSLDSQNKSKKNNFCFKGKCSIALVYGQLGINGYHLNTNLTEQSKWFDLYSPETNSFLSIINKHETKEASNLVVEQQFLINRIKQLAQINSNEFDQNLQLFLNDFSSNTSSLFLIRGFKSQICDYLGYFENFQKIYNSYSGFDSIEKSNGNQNETDVKFSHLGLYVVTEHNFNAVLIESDEEKRVANEFNHLMDNNQAGNNWPIVMACGGKDVGKSTFLRYWINLLLNKYQTVAYIDCDPGQSEFTLSGCVSLNLLTEPIFGPPHTHISHTSLVKSCYFLGNLSPGDCPSLYLQCLKQCFDDFTTYKLSLSKNQIVPLIINTMGWNQGLGLCLLKETMQLMKPTHVIQINHPIEKNKNMPLLDKSWLQTTEGWRYDKKSSTAKQAVHTSSNQDIDYKLVVIKSRAPCKTQQFPTKSSQKRFSPRDHRNIATIAYFSNLQDPKQYFKPIHYIRPYRVPWSKFGLHVSHSKVQYDQLFRVFNASLVGLCSVEPKFLIKKNDNPELPKMLETYDAEKDTPVVYKCFGFGIIRGINIETKEFYILTPEVIQTLENVNLLVNGMLTLPNEFFFEQDSETSCPYMTYSNNLQENMSNQNFGQEPFLRKYLIHQTK